MEQRVYEISAYAKQSEEKALKTQHRFNEFVRLGYETGAGRSGPCSSQG